MAGAASVNLAAETPAGLRRAALTLHALGEADQAWLLERLASGAQQTLRALIAELRELGIPANADVIRAALNEAQGAGTLSTEQARALGAVLVKEAPALQGMLLCALAADDREAVVG